MRELSLHILDLIENSIRAGASTISVRIEECPEQDRLEICVEDDGAGLRVPPDQAINPYYTTKEGKRTGLGLSLFQGAAEQAGGTLTIGPSGLGGTAVTAVMQLSHADREPLGDLATTFSSVVCTNPHLDLRCSIKLGCGECTLRVPDVAKELRADDRYGLAIARRVSEKIRRHLAAPAWPSPLVEHRVWAPDGSRRRASDV